MRGAVMQALINLLTGQIAVLPDPAVYGSAGAAVVASQSCAVLDVADDIANHIRRGHCVAVDGAISVLPEDQWPENIQHDDEEPIDGSD